MATEEHKELSTYIKNIHSSLRHKSNQIGFDLAWNEHCNNEEKLREYAKSMKKLATEYWQTSNSEKVISRIEWVYDYCNLYFFQGELQRQREREIDILTKLKIENNTFLEADRSKQLCLLDVGSCYNPFKIYECFNVTAVDIAPCESVLKCDFINIDICDFSPELSGIIHRLQRSSFHIVVFSLLLEYLPSPEQRLKCCKNAYELLKTEGILIIITPDSKHVGANAKYMKSWRYALSLVGYSRIKYEKLPYLHCMTFRKPLHVSYAQRWAEMNKNKGISEIMNIPQDKQDDRNGASI